MNGAKDEDDLAKYATNVFAALTRPNLVFTEESCIFALQLKNTLL